MQVDEHINEGGSTLTTEATRKLISPYYLVLHPIPVLAGMGFSYWKLGTLNPVTMAPVAFLGYLLIAAYYFLLHKPEKFPTDRAAVLREENQKLQKATSAVWYIFVAGAALQYTVFKNTAVQYDFRSLVNICVVALFTTFGILYSQNIRELLEMQEINPDEAKEMKRKKLWHFTAAAIICSAAALSPFLKFILHMREF